MDRLLVSALTLALVATPLLAQGPRATFAKLSGRFGAKEAQVRLVTANTEAWALRWALLSSANKTIDSTYFIVENDAFGRAFLGALVHKARSGVPVRLMLDARGNGPLSKARLDRELLRAVASVPGLSVKIYNPLGKALLKGLVNPKIPMASNHDKFLIVDSEWVVMGGRNISKNYLADPADNPHAYRDTDVVVRGGDVPAQSKRAFEEEFGLKVAEAVPACSEGEARDALRELEVARRVMDERMHGTLPKAPAQRDSADASAGAHALLEATRAEAREFPTVGTFITGTPLAPEAPAPCLVLDSNSIRGAGRDDIGPAVLALVDAAEKEIVIQNPYVVLSDEGRAALVRAARRGVAIRLYTNSAATNNHTLPQVAFEDDLPGLLRDIPELQVRMYGGERLVHSKAFVFDGQVAIVGTYNLDPLAQEINSEAVAVIDSPDFATRVALRVVRDAEESGRASSQPATFARKALKPLTRILRPLL